MTPADRAEDFLPKIVTVWREGYGRADLRADALAGLTVAIVALPLSMAIAIASGVGPERGLYTTIIGGFLVSALGGSRFQIGGPAGAFIVLVAACVGDIGVEGLIVATFLSGILLAVVGALRMGTYIRFIPYPVTVAFTAGIAVIILASQLRDFFGVTLDGPEPGPIIDKLAALWAARATITPAAMAVSAGTVALVLGLRRLRPSWPGLLIAVIAASVAAALLGLPVETIGSRFGELPRVPPVPSLPAVDAQLVLAALPWATSFALLGAIESLLSAVVADGMSGRRHRSNAELMAQGVANMGSALFGGFCVTGTIARTATNVRAGSRGPVSGMLHALFVLGFMLVAAPLASYIPLAALAGVLVLVAWNMVEKEAFWTLLRASRADAAIVLATFLLVVFRDLTEGIIAGAAIGGAVFIRRMSEAVRAESPGEEVDLDPPARQAGIVVFRLRGAWFFGAAATIGGALERMADRPRALVVDFSEVPFVDSSGIHTLELLARKLARNGGQLVLSGMSAELRASFESHGLTAPAVRYERNTADAIAAITQAGG
jgi:SulP family sulfate permease